MKDNTVELYQGYGVIPYIVIGSIGLGIVGIALGIVFTVLAYTAWVLALCWALGIILLLTGVFWQVTMGFVNDPNKIEAIADSFSDKLETNWDGKGKVLDIGTGRGRLAVEIAMRFPDAQVIGIDLWTKMWSVFGQTKAGAEKNAIVAMVGDRCTFKYGDATKLPFEDGEFQLVVSNFVFHEISTPDKMILFTEIARVLAPGGTFLILDFFSGSFLRAYKVKSVVELVEKIEQLGIEEVKHEPLLEATDIDLGRFYRHFWEIDYLSGKKKGS